MWLNGMRFWYCTGLQVGLLSNREQHISFRTNRSSAKGVTVLKSSTAALVGAQC